MPILHVVLSLITLANIVLHVLSQVQLQFYSNLGYTTFVKAVVVKRAVKLSPISCSARLCCQSRNVTISSTCCTFEGTIKIVVEHLTAH